MDYKSQTYLVHLLNHRSEFVVVLQNFVELGHRVSAELVRKTRHFGSRPVFLSDRALVLVPQFVTADRAPGSEEDTGPMPPSRSVGITTHRPDKPHVINYST